MNKLLAGLLIIISCESAIAGKRAKEMHVAWCVNICMEDIFKDVHSKGDSWGSSSSSINGFKQDNAFVEIKNYCQSIYEKSCYEVHRSAGTGIHGNGVYYATTVSN
jgi:hypothetical protein